MFANAGNTQPSPTHAMAPEETWRLPNAKLAFHTFKSFRSYTSIGPATPSFEMLPGFLKFETAKTVMKQQAPIACTKCCTETERMAYHFLFLTDSKRYTCTAPHALQS